MEATEQDARLPLILGVTGHRKIDVVDPRLVECLRGELLRLRQAYPHSPFLIVSGLAEGADRLVARLAMESVAAKLIAILPFPEAEFRKDFNSAASQNEFSELLKQAQAVVAAPQRETIEALRVPGASRNRQYARAGAYVVEQAQVLIAVWDGQPARGIGGTGDVVQWRLSGDLPLEFSALMEPRNVLWPKPPTRLIHVHPTSYEVKCPDADEGADSALKSVDAYNAELSAFVAEQGTALPGPGLEVLVEWPRLRSGPAIESRVVEIVARFRRGGRAGLAQSGPRQCFDFFGRAPVVSRDDQFQSFRLEMVHGVLRAVPAADCGGGPLGHAQTDRGALLRLPRAGGRIARGGVLADRGSAAPGFPELSQPTSGHHLVGPRGPGQRRTGEPDE